VYHRRPEKRPRPRRPKPPRPVVSAVPVVRLEGKGWRRTRKVNWSRSTGNAGEGTADKRYEQGAFPAGRAHRFGVQRVCRPLGFGQPLSTFPRVPDTNARRQPQCDV
jgi:hypothetical protein